MQIKQFDDAHTLVLDLRAIRFDIVRAGAADGLGVTIQGRYQDGLIVTAARAAVLLELRRREQVLVDKLAAFDVQA